VPWCITFVYLFPLLGGGKWLTLKRGLLNPTSLSGLSISHRSIVPLDMTLSGEKWSNALAIKSMVALSLLLFGSFVSI